MGFFTNNNDKAKPINKIEPLPEKKNEPIQVIEKPLEKKIETQTIPKPIIPQNMQKNVTTISEGTTIEGQLKIDGNIHIEGLVKGTITCKEKVTLGVNGKIDGDVHCNEADISGTITGKINVKDILFLKGNALVHGDILTGKLVMESGVKFNGKCNMGGVAQATTATNGNSNSNGNTMNTATVAEVNIPKVNA